MLIVEVLKGNKSEAVRGVSEEFQFRNISGDPAQARQVDGDSGPRTDAAVRAFQRAIHPRTATMAVVVRSGRAASSHCAGLRRPARRRRPRRRLRG